MPSFLVFYPPMPPCDADITQWLSSLHVEAIQEEQGVIRVEVGSFMCVPVVVVQPAPHSPLLLRRRRPLMFHKGALLLVLKTIMLLR